MLKRKQHVLLLDSTWDSYGEEQEERGRKLKPEKVEADGKAYSIGYPLKGYGVLVFEF